MESLIWLCQGDAYKTLHMMYSKLSYAKSLLASEEGKIVVEETVREMWSEIQNSITTMKELFPALFKTVISHDTKLHTMLLWIHKHISESLTPEKFVNIFSELIHLPDFDRNIKFLLWTMQCPTRCKRAFTII